MGRASGALSLVEFARPVGPRNREPRPLDEGLPQEGGGLESPVDPVLFAAAFGYGGHATVPLDVGGAFEALTVFAKGDEKSRRVDGTGGGETPEDFEFGEFAADSIDFLVVVFDGNKQRLELRDEGFD